MGIAKQSGRRDVLAAVPQRCQGNIPSKSPGGRCPRKRGLLLACLAVLGLAGQARAEVIVLQPHDATGGGAFSNLGPSNQQVADNFQLSQVSTLESLSWFGRYGSAAVTPTNPVAFSIRLFTDRGAVPAVSPLQELNVLVDAQVTGLTFGGIPWFSYSTLLPAFTLDPGTYWVSVVESDPQTPTFGNTQWLWGQSNPADGRAFRLSDGASWNQESNPNMAFSLQGTVVPEPSAFLLCGLGAIGLGCSRWWRVVGGTRT